MLATEGAGGQADWKRTFFSIWAGQTLSIVGSSVAQFALVWWITSTTGSATVLATATMVAMLPAVFLAPFSGALVDRWNRRLVLIVSDGFAALMAAWLAYLFWSGSMQIWHVYVVMFLRSLAGGFHWPAMQASTSLLVPKEHLARIAGLNQTLHGVTNIIGPPTGALLLAVLPLHGIMGIDVVTASLAIVPLLFVRIPQPLAAPVAAGVGAVRSLLQDVREGLRYVWGWRGLTLLLAGSTLLNFLAIPAFSLTPILVTKRFGGEALQLASMNSAWGIGVVAGGLALSAWGGFRRKTTTSFCGLTAMGLGMAIIGLAPATAFPLAVAGMLLAGAMNPIANGPLFAVMQSTVAPEMQGRVFTLMMSASSAASPISLAVAGPVADALGVQVWYAFAGIATVIMGVGAFFIPAVYRMEDERTPPAPAVAAAPEA